MAEVEELAQPEAIARWEAFCNQEDERSSLVSRFSFEPVCLATLHFAESPGEFFRLVLSTTSPIQFTRS